MMYLRRCIETLCTTLPEWHTYTTVTDTYWDGYRTLVEAPTHNNPLILNMSKSIHHEDIKLQ